jgi:transcription initiation factor TFIIA small subunit
MSYQLYRNTTLGHTLQESLDELIQYNQITPALASKILLQFDRSMSNALANRVKSRLTFKAGKLHTYRFCDNVWTFLLNDVEFREVNEFAKVDKVGDSKRRESRKVACWNLRS